MRIENKVIDIDEKLTSEFWDNRAKNGMNLKTVLLNEELDDSIICKRNNKELNIVKSVLPEQASVLDIGCGIGRWADNLKNYISFYEGIDYTESLIDIAKQRFDGSNNINFLNMSASNLDRAQLHSSYDMAIITGVLMYINDKDINGLLDFLNETITDTIYIQESIGINTRLTLDNIYSDSLKDNYSAIYRTKREYKAVFTDRLTNFAIESTNLLLDEDMTPHKETTAMYWILKRLKG